MYYLKEHLAFNLVKGIHKTCSMILYKQADTNCKINLKISMYVIILYLIFVIYTER